MVESVSLKEFGFNFCGPVIHTYLTAVNDYIKATPSNVYCLAREGYLLQKGLQLRSLGKSLAGAILRYFQK